MTIESSFAAGRAIRKTAITPMMSQRNLLGNGILQAFSQIISIVIIDQSAGIYAHLAILLDDHFAKGAHKLTTAFFVLIAGHAVF